MRPSFVIAAALGAFASPALAQDAYVVGITAALTGPPASTYAPAIEALRIYLDRVNAAGGAHAVGSTVVLEATIPPPAGAHSPFATLIQVARATWVFSWAPRVTQVPTFDALRRLGWAGDSLTWAHLEAEGELKRIKDDRLF